MEEVRNLRICIELSFRILVKVLKLKIEGVLSKLRGNLSELS